jgi:hypothetical protein
MRTDMHRLAIAALLFVSIDAAAQCVTATAACPSVLTASLTASDCSSYDGSRYDLHEFSAAAGTTITIQLHSASFDPFVGLIDPNGVPVAINDDVSAGSTDAKIVHTLTTGGTYTVFANNLLASGAAGDYELTISGCAMGPRRRSARH